MTTRRPELQSLWVLLGGELMGAVHREGDRLRFVYDEDWRTSTGTIPLSISLPLDRAEHDHDAIEPFLWGLLPDSEKVLQHIGREFGVSPRNPFALLAHTGEDCAGAAQLVRPDRLEQVRNPAAASIAWLEPSEVAERLREVRERASTGRRPTDAGQFSLAGAQPKVALLLHEGRWGIPSGRVPTTHILKPPTGAFDGLAENEHFCLELVRALGLPAARARTERIGDEVALIVERYDRLLGPGGPESIRRVHQEDLCQALGRPPTRRYQNEGGPTPKEIVELLRTWSARPSEDVNTFVDSLGYNWLVGGPDAHAKNYSVLHGRGRVRLAPLYDIASWLPYGHLRDARMAMKIGGTYEFTRTTAWRWRALAKELALDEAALFDRLRRMAERIPDEASRIRDEFVGQGLSQESIGKLAGAISARAAECLASLDGT